MLSLEGELVMAVDPFGTAEPGTTVLSSAALVLSQQARQGVSEQLERIAQKSQETDQDQKQLKTVMENSESAKADTQPQQDQEAEYPSSQSEPSRGQTVNIKV
jgi:hypothetical protein